eukprot:4925903-Alexandrium_andersonii.AAC.1
MELWRIGSSSIIWRGGWLSLPGAPRRGASGSSALSTAASARRRSRASAISRWRCGCRARRPS